MGKRLILLICLSGLIFLAGIFVGHFKPLVFQIPYSFFKEVASNDPDNLYKDSVDRLNNRFRPGSCKTDNEGYSFFIAGHTYGTPGLKYEGLYGPFKSNKRLKDCAFLPLGFLLGDTVVEASHHEFGVLKKDIESFRDNTKVYIATGNHEVGTGPYNAKRDIYIENFGAETYKYIEYKNDLFVILDTNINNWNLNNDQISMLKNLESNEGKYKNIFIFSHQIFWIEDGNPKFSGLIPNSQEGRAKELNFWKEVFPIAKEIGDNLFFFAGDVGAFNNKSEFFYRSISGVDFFATGMGGGQRDNFMLIHVDKKKVDIELVEF